MCVGNSDSNDRFERKKTGLGLFTSYPLLVCNIRSFEQQYVRTGSSYTIACPAVAGGVRAAGSLSLDEPRELRERTHRT
eukprot:COSAG06_NODE_3245_length_5623_cov_14.623823_5_plen_79_part_00